MCTCNVESQYRSAKVSNLKKTTGVCPSRSYYSMVPQLPDQGNLMRNRIRNADSLDGLLLLLDPVQLVVLVLHAPLDVVEHP